MHQERHGEEKEFSFKNWIISHRFILTIFVIYFFLHLLHLTLLPPFNDESIYIDWAWSYTHMSGHLYDSLLDAKQPLMFWIFAFFQNFFLRSALCRKICICFIWIINNAGDICCFEKNCLTSKLLLLPHYSIQLFQYLFFITDKRLWKQALHV